MGNNTGHVPDFVSHDASKTKTLRISGHSSSSRDKAVFWTSNVLNDGKDGNRRRVAEADSCILHSEIPRFCVFAPVQKSLEARNYQVHCKFHGLSNPILRAHLLVSRRNRQRIGSMFGSPLGSCICPQDLDSGLVEASWPDFGERERFSGICLIIQPSWV